MGEHMNEINKQKKKTNKTTITTTNKGIQKSKTKYTVQYEA